MNSLSRLLFRKAHITHRSVLRNSQFRAACVFCLYRCSPSLQAPRSGVNLGVKSACYGTGSDDKQTKTKKNFYRVLGVSPKATQEQIKNAFYKLSIKHHPDKHKGSEKSHEKFQEISEAYNVLGNQETRKQYDQEWVFGGRSRADTHTSEPPVSPKKPPESIYNFDEWTRAHYSDQLDREHRSRQKQAEFDKELKEPRIALGSTRTLVLILLTVTFILAYYWGKKSEENFFQDQ